jgi:hypothetical protein
LYKPNEVYIEELMWYRKNLSPTVGRVSKVEFDLAFRTSVGKLGKNVGGLMELRPIDVINDLFTWESKRGGKSSVVDFFSTRHSLQKFVLGRKGSNIEVKGGRSCLLEEQAEGFRV